MDKRCLPEIADQAWCPASIRYAMRSFIQCFVLAVPVYDDVVPEIQELLEHSTDRTVVDLCSGSGGPWPRIVGCLAKLGAPVERVTLSDRYPDTACYEHFRRESDGLVGFAPQPVDANRVPDGLGDVRTLFTSFHHFEPDAARNILRDAAQHRHGIGVFEMVNRSVIPMLFIALFSFTLPILVVPFLRPFRWQSLFWTYVLPLLPFVACYDGVTSCLAAYSVKDLAELTSGRDFEGYEWKAGCKRNPISPFGVTYLIGYPAEAQTTVN